MKENSQTLTIKEWLKSAKMSIPSLDAELIMCAVLKVNDRSDLVLKEAEDLTVGEKKRADEMTKRRKNGEPLAYITGEKEFFGRKFMVTPAVLIPRPETEEVVKIALEITQSAVKNGKKLQIIDIGTGSGCIAVTLAKELEEEAKNGNVEILATDVSLAALKIAERNARRLGAKVKFTQADLLSGVELAEDKKVLIVANLPYVDENWGWIDKKTLEFEPREALYAGQGGLELVYKLFVQFAQVVEKSQGEKRCKNYNVLVETDTSQQREVIEFAAKNDIKHRKTEGFAMLFEQ